MAWTGAWNSTWSEEGENFSALMNLKQTGSSVTGTFEDNTSTISGNVTGNTLTGTWTELNGTGKFTGSYRFTLSPDANSFTGRWAFTPEGLANSTETWSGVRV